MAVIFRERMPRFVVVMPWFWGFGIALSGLLSPEKSIPTSEDPERASLHDASSKAPRSSTESLGLDSSCKVLRYLLRRHLITGQDRFARLEPPTPPQKIPPSQNESQLT